MNQQNNNLGISDSTIRKLGIDESFLQFSDTLEELSKKTPNIVIAEATRNFEFVQNHYKLQQMRKKNKYVMSLSVFQKLQYDPRNKNKLLKPTNATFKKLYKKYNGESLDNKTLLVWRTGGIGDLLFIQPNLVYLKEKYPNSKIIFSCAPQYQPMVEDWDCIDEIITLPFNYTYLLKSDYHAIFEGVIERCKEAETTNCYKLFTRWLDLNLSEEKLVPKLNVKSNLVEECENILRDNFNIDIENDKVILCQYRASSIIRSLKPEIFGNIINELTNNGYKVIITDSPNQSEYIRNFIMNNVENKDKVFNFSGYSKSIDYTIALASIISCSLSTDSSLIHISQAVGTPVLGIYGPFPGKVRMETYRNSDWIDCESSCAPCFLHGHKSCGHSDKDGYSKCFENLDINLIAEKVGNLINDQNISNSEE